MLDVKTAVPDVKPLDRITDRMIKFIAIRPLPDGSRIPVTPGAWESDAALPPPLFPQTGPKGRQ
jgi:hypothetical protein